MEEHGDASVSPMFTMRNRSLCEVVISRGSLSQEAPVVARICPTPSQRHHNKPELLIMITIQRLTYGGAYCEPGCTCSVRFT